jgi:L-ascorbate metabolism protein UlaG (beta-lactamase superfamily)
MKGHDTPLYLRPDVQVEPLCDQWYAWSYLIPPPTAARNITHRHLKIMDSYISTPEVHADAVKDPKMLGGPFIDYGGERVDEIRQLQAETKQKRARLLELSQAITDLDALLRSQAKGMCLHSLYPLIPAALRGLVELVYDLNNHASFRLIEPLFYRSDYYDVSQQSIGLSLTTGDDRPFVLSTPRLPDARHVQLDVPFRDSSLDELFRLKTEAQPRSRIADLFQIPDGREQLFWSFFTDVPTRRYEPYTGSGIRWRYFGHACILVETRTVSMLFDPVLSYTYESGISRYTYEDLPERVDFIVITHNHQDHILFETLLQLRHKVGTIVVPRSGGGSLQDPSLRLILENTGFRNVVELTELQELPFPGGSILALPFLGEHGDLDVRSKLAYAVRLGTRQLLFAADSCNIEPELYRRLAPEIGRVDALFLGMECDGAPLSWLYGPLLTQPLARAVDGSRRLAGSNYEQAIDIVDRFGCREAYVYAMGQEPWLNHVMSIKYTNESRPIVDSNRLIEACTGRGIVAERLFGEKEILIDADVLAAAPGR